MCGVYCPSPQFTRFILLALLFRIGASFSLAAGHSESRDALPHLPRVRSSSDGTGNSSGEANRHRRLHIAAVITWATLSSSSMYTPRVHHCAVVYDGKLLVIAGQGQGGQLLNDVWYSDDGMSWEKFTSSYYVLKFSPRMGLGCVGWNSKWLAVIGGQQINGVSNEVWFSVSGQDWLPLSPNFTARAFFGTTEFEGRMWVIGGTNGSLSGTWPFVGPFLNDVLVSSDGGSSWTVATPRANFSPRAAMAVTVRGQALWMVGGRGTQSYSDVWYTYDGVYWVYATSSAAFAPRACVGLAAFDGMLIVLGGQNSTGGALQDSWSSFDGATWQSGGPPPAPIFGTVMAVFEEKLLTTGGSTGAGLLTVAYSLQARLTCGDVSFSCPTGYVANSASTICRSSNCTISDCCT
eukprot:RCo036889